jgi:single-strand DNA-binding protein
VDNPRDKDSPFWFNIEFWGKLSEVVDRHLSKGRQISLCGDLRYESWVDKDSGKDCYKYVIVAREFRFLGGGGAAQVQSDSIF